VEWSRKLEDVAFNQLTLPLTKRSSPRNVAIYEKIGAALKWSTKEKQDFWNFAVELPEL